MSEKKRGRPRKYPEGYDRRKAWNEKTGYEQSSDRKKQKAEWLRQNRKKLSQAKNNLGDLSVKTHPQIKEAIFALAQVCDHAASVDGQGFNGGHAHVGHSMADQLGYDRPLSRKQHTYALKMLRTYTRQLNEKGIELPTEEALEAFLDALESKVENDLVSALEEKPKKASGKVQLMGSALIVSFEYDPAKVAAIKTIKGARFNGEGRFWQLPLTASERLASVFPDFEYDAAIAERVQSAQAEALAIAAAKRVEMQQLLDVADLEAATPDGRFSYQHQKDAVKWSIEQIQSSELRGVILALDMGLGKSRVSLLIARAYQKLFDIPVFVICPASLRVNWQREAEGVGTTVEIFSWSKIPKPIDVQEYVLIADEAHFAQAGEKSKRGKDFLQLARNSNCKAALLLTGTPLKNGRPVNLFPLLQASNHELAQDKVEYERYFCAARATAFSRWDTTGAAHLDELHAKAKNVMLRKTKAECLDLPAKTRVLKPAEVTGESLKSWNQAHKDAQQKHEENRGKGKGEALVLMNDLRKAASAAKVDSAIDFAKEVLEQGQSVVLFAEFVETAKALQKALGGEMLIGETPIEERQEMVDRFQSGQSKVFVSTSRAGGVGITLTKAQTVIMVDRPWTPGDAIQCEDRCHRISQNNAVTAIWLQWSEIDEKVDGILEQKQERIELVLQGKRKTLRGIKSPLDIIEELAEAILGKSKKK